MKPEPEAIRVPLACSTETNDIEKKFPTGSHVTVIGTVSRTRDWSVAVEPIVTVTPGSAWASPGTTKATRLAATAAR